MLFNLAPLYYQSVDAPFVFGLKPLEHQHKTLELVEQAMQEKRTLAIINASVTGSGKTLANYAYSLLHHPTPTIGVYPTNELIRDQERSLLERGVQSMTDLIRIDSAELDDWQQRMNQHAHIQVLQTLTGNWTDEKPIILTNPDILYLLMYNAYGYHKAFLSLKERVLQNIVSNYPIVIFDEFHIYNVKQEANAVFIAATMAKLAPEKPHIFIFSSATPNTKRLQGYLQRVGIESCSVHTPALPSGEIVCEPVTLEILPADLMHWQGQETIIHEFDRIKTILDTYSDARSVFILDSVYEAKLLASYLREQFGVEQVGELHGYLDVDARRGALERRFTVGTTTIDVGVDFTGSQVKHLLVFEARSPEQFMQRLGRLGRQRRMQLDIPNYAFAFVPEYVCSALQEKYPQLINQPSCSREELSEAINDAYIPRNTFTGYLSKYAPLEATAAVERIMQQYPSDVRPDYAERLRDIVIALFPRKDGSTFLYDSLRRQQWYVWRNFGDTKSLQWNIQGKIVRKKITFFTELEQFRGGSGLLCAVYDKLDEQQGFFPFKTYAFPFVARRTIFHEISRDAFLEHLDRYKKHNTNKVDRFIHELRDDNILTYVVVEDLVYGASQQLCLELNFEEVHNGVDLEQLHRFETLQLNLSAPQPCSVKKANATMARIGQKNGWLCWVSTLSPQYITNRYGLPPLFEIFPLKLVTLGGGEIGKENSWTVALGLSAIFMDSLPKMKHDTGRAMFA